MTTATSLVAAYEVQILQLLTEGRTYEEISTYFMRWSDISHGLSPRTIRRFCSTRGLSCRVVDDRCLDRVLTAFVSRLGHSYGRRTMQGDLRSQGMRVSQVRIAASLQCIAPIHYSAHHHSVHQAVNPIP